MDEDLANLINLLFERPPSMEEFVKLMEDIKRPANCGQLQVAPVPQAIWCKISNDLIGKDKVWQRLHGDFLLFVIKVLRCFDDLHKLVPVCPDINSTVEELTEAFKIATFVHKVGFVDHRREALKPDLPGEFKRLAGANFPRAQLPFSATTWSSQ